MIESTEGREIIHVTLIGKERNISWDRDPINNRARFLYSH